MIQALDNRFRSWGERRASLREVLNRAAASAGELSEEIAVGLELLRGEARWIQTAPPVIPSWGELAAADGELLPYLRGMLEQHYLTIAVHYVCTENARRRQKLAGVMLCEPRAMRDRRYWDLIDRGHWWLAGRAHDTNLLREAWQSGTSSGPRVANALESP